jgi:hypothetical protein
MRPITAKLINGPRDGLWLTVDAAMLQICFPILVPTPCRYVDVNDGLHPDDLVPTKLALYVRHSDSPYGNFAWFVYAGTR